jgi:hypothetical protein
MTKEKTPLGEYWKDTNYTPLYQLYNRVDYVAHEMRQRHKDGHAPTKALVEELEAIAIELKILDKHSKGLPKS